MEFINEHPKNEVILLTIYYRELITLRDTIIARKNITFDTSGHSARWGKRWYYL